MLRSAGNLQRDGKFDGALGLYREVVKGFPGTPQAGEAAARVRALGGK
jgi:hypothetical protein